MEFGVITALLVVTIYILLVALLWKTGILDRLHISAVGPLLMIRTKRGIRFLDRLARHDNFFRRYGNVSLGIVLFFMVLQVVLFVWMIPATLQAPVSAALGPEMIIGLPGINPIIPVGYGIIGLIIAILVHEFAHGVLTRVGKVEVKSVGVVILVVPIGAFVEPEDEGFKQMSRRMRARLHAVGPATNILLALVAAGIFSLGFMGSVEPVEDGVVIRSVVKDSPAGAAGLRPWALMTEISIPNGTGLDQRVRSEEDFTDIMARTSAGDNITITYRYQGTHRRTSAVLLDKYEYYQKNHNETNKEEYRGKGFLGVQTMSADALSSALAHPLNFGSAERFVSGVGTYISLPLIGMQPFDSHITDLYHVTGPLAALPPGIFWVLANMFYWLFWLNVVIGTFNALPIPLLDGGVIFKDGLDSLAQRLWPAWDAEKRARRVSLLYRMTGLVMVIIIALLFLGPRIGALI